MKKRLDFGNLVIIVITLILFIVALFVTGLTKAILLEAAVFLVSLKIILMSHKISLTEDKILRELKEIKEDILKHKQ